MQPLLSLSVVVTGLSIATMSAVARPTEPGYSSYYVSLILVIMWIYTFIRLRFWYALTASLIIVTGYEIVAIVYQGLLASPMGLLVFVNNNFFFVTANIIGGFAAYYLELHTRRDFAQRRTIELEKAKTENLLQKEAEAALRASEERFRTLVEISVDSIAILDSKGRLNYISPACERLLGYSPAELIGRKFIEFIHPDDLPQVERSFALQFQQPDQAVLVETRVRHKDGSWRIVEGVSKTMPAGNVVSYTHDITERRQIEDALRAVVEDRLKLSTARSSSDLALCCCATPMAFRKHPSGDSSSPPTRVRAIL
jgi:PAS domain S-box-containing protein